MMRKRITQVVSVLMMGSVFVQAQTRQQTTMKEGWEFRRGEQKEWNEVNIPHDWAIYGPFDRSNDLQNVQVVQNLEKRKSEKTGRTGGLPYTGKGEYRRTITFDEKDIKDGEINLLFDGAMSEAKVYLNDQFVGEWPLGYNSFYFDVTKFAKAGENSLLVKLNNEPQSSRWYPGAGLYRNVHVIKTNKIHIPIWGTQITTPYVGEEYASVHLKSKIANLAEGETVRVVTEVVSPSGEVVAVKDNTQKINYGMPAEQHFTIDKPLLWSPESPNLYEAKTKLYVDNKLQDEYTTRFGVRTIELRADKGFFLNGKMRKFQGVCLHHDLGPLGAAINKAAIRKQITMLKDMGCDAIRTSHNMPAPELVELCDEMGMMLMLEPFDEWDVAKCDNGYHRFFEQWAEKDMINMLHQFRNNASVVMWSVGNEVPTQSTAGGYKVAAWLQEICKQEDPTRPVTCGMDRINDVLENGFAAQFDIAGFNYKVSRYDEAYAKLPQGLILGSETSSTVSSRGSYHFPITKGAAIKHKDHQSSSYDVEYCPWSNIVDEDLAADEDLDYMIGQFVWTGFDYLGEPTPYDTDAWPNHSSVFGIIDLASIPKDRYYLYRSVWNEDSETLHVLPHWNWKGREGKVTPVFAYTSYPKAELFVNGVSQGVQEKDKTSLMGRYRLMWNDVKYKAGEIKVVAYDENGYAKAEKTIKTAGSAYKIELTPDRRVINADGEDLTYINVRVVDRDGNPVPTDQRSISFDVKGAGKFRAVANGDPTSLEMFHNPKMKLFNGQLTLIVQSGKNQGKIEVEAKGSGVKAATVFIDVQ